MKPWLFDILACPMDKHYPLKLFIFSYENKPEEFNSFLSTYEKRDTVAIRNENVIEISQKEDKLIVKDNIIIQENPIEEYMNLIISSVNELNNVYDKSTFEGSKKCFNIASSIVKENLDKFSKKIKSSKELDAILPELYLLNQIKIDIEIESGVLFCEKCLRWFPIIDTIPQMLPDGYRDKKKELEFLKTNKNLLGEEFLKQDIKPFKL